MSTDEVERNGGVNGAGGNVWSSKMDTNNNNRITDGSPNATTNQFCFGNAAIATIPAYGGGAVSAHDMNLAQILYYQSLLKQQTTVASKLSNRNNALPQYSVLNNPSILPQVPGSPTNRSFAAALRNLAKQIGPGPNTSPERDNNVNSDNRQTSPKSRFSSSLLRNSSPTPLTSKTTDKEKSSSNLENRSGFQPYRPPDESRLAASSSSLTSQPSSAVTHAANPYGLDPATAAAFSPYHAAAAAAAAAAFYPTHMQHAYSRFEEQWYLERCGVSLFPPSPFTPSLYGMMPASLGLLSPAIHERLKLEEQERQRETLERERERNEREKREKSKKSPRASPSHNHLNDHSARKVSITSSSANSHRSQSPLSSANSPSLSSRLPQSSPTPTVNPLSSSGSSSVSVPFIRPFEDNYSPVSRRSPSKASSSTTTKNPFLPTLSENVSPSSTLNSSTASIPYAPLSLSTNKLPHPFECFSASKTPDPPSAHMSSQTTTSPVYLNAANATDASAASFLPAAAGTGSNIAVNSTFKPYSAYPYDLMQYSPFKNHMISQMSLCNTSNSPPLPKKSRPNSSILNGGGESMTNSHDTTLKSAIKSNRNGSGKSRSKSNKSFVDKKKSSTGISIASTIPVTLSTSTTDTNTIPLNLSTTNENLKADAIFEETMILAEENKEGTASVKCEENSPSTVHLALTEEVK